MNQLSFSAPVIFVKRITTSRQFYEDILDQQVKNDFGNNIMFESGFSIWELKPEYEITRIAGISSNGNTFELCFETEDISASYKKIKEAGTRLFHPVKTEPWGQKTFRFFDPDQHLLEIGESFDIFIRRIYKDLKSIEQTSAITGVPQSTIKTILGKN